MTQRIVHDAAVANLDEILDFLTIHAGKPVALRYATAFQKAFNRLSEFPASGAPRSNLGPGTRLVMCLIFYDYFVSRDTVQVLRVLHSHRNITKQSLRP